MGKQVGFIFKNESDLDDTLESNRRTLAIDTQGNKTPLSDTGIAYAKITALVAGSDGKEAKAIEVVFDGATNTHVAPDGVAWVYDSDNIPADHTTTNIRSSIAMKVDDIIEVSFYPDKSEVSQWIRAGFGGGTSLIWVNTGNGIASDPLEFGATYDVPAGTATALDNSAIFRIATPWNTAKIAPEKYFGYFVNVGNNWYKNITEFGVKSSVNYSSTVNEGMDTFQCFFARSDSSKLIGDQDDFPAGIQVILDDFDNVNAGTSSLEAMKDKTFWGSYDSAANIIYLIDKNRF